LQAHPIEVVAFNTRQFSALRLPFERVDGTVAGPAENSMSGSVGVVAIKATWFKQGWGQEDGGFVKQ
jgi:hypothetical protein